MYNGCVEGARQPAHVIRWRCGGGPENSDQQILGQSSETLQAVAPRLYICLCGNISAILHVFLIGNILLCNIVQISHMEKQLLCRGLRKR